MDTIKVGDKFETECFSLIEKAISRGDLGITEANARVFQKKGYYSKEREKDIIFDLAIEIWPKTAERFIILFLIECKSYSSKNIPIDDIEEFHRKIQQVSGVNVKGIMISNSSFQEGVLTYARNNDFMLIEAQRHDDFNIILHKASRKNNSQDSISLGINSKVATFLKKTLGPQKVSGLQKLSASQIEKLAEDILRGYNKLKSPIEIIPFCKYLESISPLSFDFTKNLETLNNKRIDGFYSCKEQKIYIDRSLYGKPQFAFIVGHEIGHYFLHQNLKINQESYNEFKDSEYNPFTKRHDLTNDKHWIEWQANKFSMSLVLPKLLFLSELVDFRNKLGITNPEHIFFDDQPINKSDYIKTVIHLARYFGTSNLSVRFQIEDLGLITYSNKEASFIDTISGL